MGEAAELTAGLQGILSDHLSATCTGVALRVQRGQRVIVELAAGTADPEAGDDPVMSSSPFDLASLTKLFVASAALRLAASGDLGIGSPVAHYLPEFDGGGKRVVTVWHLLTHSSGLPAIIRLYDTNLDRDAAWTRIYHCPLENEPGTTVVYSDVGFMLLGRVVEVAGGAGLSQLVEELVTAPLHMSRTRYGPVAGAVATEFDSWRDRRLRGEVHDENASVLGGVAGHAGLFGTVEDTARLARAYADPTSRFLPAALTSRAVTEQIATGAERRGLGWKLRSTDSTASESAFTSATYGHYGYTGTAIWTDPLRDLTIVLFTNRVYFGRDPDGIRELRRAVFDRLTAETPVSGLP